MNFCLTCGRQVDYYAAFCPGCGCPSPGKACENLRAGYALTFLAGAAWRGLKNRLVPEKKVTITLLSWPNPLSAGDESRRVLSEEHYPLDSWDTFLQFHQDNSFRPMAEILKSHLPGYLAHCRRQPGETEGVILPNSNFTVEVLQRVLGVSVTLPSPPKKLLMPLPPFPTWFDRRGQLRCRLTYYAVRKADAHQLENDEHLQSYRMVAPVDDDGPLGMSRIAVVYDTEAMLLIKNQATNQTLCCRDAFEGEVMHYWEELQATHYQGWDVPTGHLDPSPWSHFRCVAKAVTREQVEQIAHGVSVFLNAQRQMGR